MCKPLATIPKMLKLQMALRNRVELPAAPQVVILGRGAQRLVRERRRVLVVIVVQETTELRRRREEPTWPAILMVSLDLLAPVEVGPPRIDLHLLLVAPLLQRVRLVALLLQPCLQIREALVVRPLQHVDPRRRQRASAVTPHLHVGVSLSAAAAGGADRRLRRRQHPPRRIVVVAIDATAAVTVTFGVSLAALQVADCGALGFSLC